VSTLEAPLFPRRDWIGPEERDAAERIALGGSAARHLIVGPVRALEHWVKGGTFHRYGRSVYQQLEDELGSAEAAVEEIHRVGSRLKFEGEMVDGRLRWMVTYRRSGDPDAFGLSSGGSTAQDVAYSALHMIEEHEREVYERDTVLGLA
jgi:hypothetical protein